MSHRLLSASAAKLVNGAAPAAVAAGGAPAAPAAGTDADPVDVVTVTDAQAAIAQASIDGAAAERTRTNAVMTSDAGKANPQLSAFMLNANPTASATSIIEHVAAQPAVAPVVAAAPAPAAPAAEQPALTTPLTETPLIAVGADANNGSADGRTAEDDKKMWDEGMAGAAASQTNRFGEDLAPGIPRTGN